MDAADRVELLRLAEQSTQPRVRAELTRLAAAIPESPAAPQQAEPRLETATALVGGGGGACAPRAGGAAPVSYVEPRHAWEQSNEFVTVLVMDLPPFLTKEAKEQVTCRIAEDSVDLVVPPNIRLRLFPLEKLINAPESTFKVKRTQIEIALRKKSQFEHWGQLLSKKSAREVREEEKDPSLMIQNMMKTMYEEGDPNMKKIIAESMMKSRQGGGGGAAGLDDKMGDF